MKHWTDYTPEQALEQKLNLSVRTDITAPLNEMGERCSWPWEPQQLVGAPMGQYHCGWCGAMVIAGIPHIDYTVDPKDEDRDLLVQLLGYNLVTAVLTTDDALHKAAEIARSMLGIDGEDATIRWMIVPHDELGGRSPVFVIATGETALVQALFDEHVKDVT